MFSEWTGTKECVDSFIELCGVEVEGGLREYGQGGSSKL